MKQERVSVLHRLSPKNCTLFWSSTLLNDNNFSFPDSRDMYKSFVTLSVRFYASKVEIKEI